MPAFGSAPADRHANIYTSFKYEPSPLHKTLMEADAVLHIWNQKQRYIHNMTIATASVMPLTLCIKKALFQM